jgi:hypothetical protein
MVIDHVAGMVWLGCQLGRDQHQPLALIVLAPLQPAAPGCRFDPFDMPA